MLNTAKTTDKSGRLKLQFEMNLFITICNKIWVMFTLLFHLITEAVALEKYPDSCLQEVKLK